MFRFISPRVIASMLLATPLISQAAGFGIDATRLIYPQGSTSISVSVRNTETSIPYLVKAEVSKSAEKVESAPFDATPPLLRLDPGSTNQVRVIARDVSHLPADRESLFYFHTSAIPSSQLQETDNNGEHAQGSVKFGVGNIIKIFYRPKGLSGSPVDAQRGLKFTRVSQGLKVDNPSPYFVSFSGVSVGGKPLSLKASEAKMIAPFSSWTWSATGVQGSVNWKTISDEGGINAFSQTLP